MPKFFTKIFFEGISLIFLSALIAICSTAFLHSLNYFFGLFTENLWLVFSLPLFGVLSLWVYDRLTLATSSSHLNYEDIINYQSKGANNLGWGSALLIFTSASLSQLFGASTGREGAAVQYGASLGSATAKLHLKIFKTDTKSLLIRAGIVGGFSSLFGSPLAALIFLGERFGFKQDPEDSAKWAAVSYLSFYFSEIFKAPHTKYPGWPGFHWSYKMILSFFVLFLTILFATVLYQKTTKTLTYYYNAFFPRSYLRIFTAGVVMAILTWSVGSSKYNGLGLSMIQSSFINTSPWFDAVLKSIFTLISITSGFKGGEVTPLMAIGASLGSSVAPYLNLPLIAASAVGAIFFFAQTLSLPLTGAVLMVELFGAPSAPVAICFGLLLWGFKYSKFQGITWSSTK